MESLQNGISLREQNIQGVLENIVSLSNKEELISKKNVNQEQKIKFSFFE